MKNYSDTEYKKDRHRYGILASLPIMIAILHLIASLVLMSYIKVDEAGTGFNHVFCLGETYGTAMLTSLLVSLKLDATLVGSASSVVAVVVALVMIFLSSAAVKGNKLCFTIAGGIYAFDCLVMIVCFFLGLASIPLKLAVYDIILGSVIHIVGLALFGYGIFLSKRLQDYEYNESLVNNTIHIQKGEGK